MKLATKLLNLNWKSIEKADAKRIKFQRKVLGVATMPDYNYMNDDKQEHMLDFHYVSGCNIIVPVVIDIHGGGWMYGYKELNRNFCMNLTKRGYVVANVNYTLAPEATINQQIKEVFTAIKFIKENCAIFNADMKNFYLVGDSAGGHIASLVSLINGNKELEKLFDVEPLDINFNCIGLISPITNLKTFNPLMRINLPIILGDKYKQSKFYNYINFKELYTDRELPPYFLMTSSGDVLARYQTHGLNRFMNKKNITHKMMDYSSYKGHLLQHVFCVTDTEWEPSQNAIDDMIAFFNEFKYELC